MNKSCKVETTEEIKLFLDLHILYTLDFTVRNHYENSFGKSFFNISVFPENYSG